MEDRMEIFSLDGRAFIEQVIRGDKKDFPSLLIKGQDTPLVLKNKENVNDVSKGTKRIHPHKKRKIEVPSFADKLAYDRPLYFLMNLPATAIEFLDVFTGSAKSLTGEFRDVHVVVYCFSNVGDEEIKERVQRSLGHSHFDILEIREVRDVAPNKRMFSCHLMLKDSLLRNIITVE
eukprot:Gregarina_sp_Poly_1__9899@NODE_646_length_6978_cov_73_701490_g492_i0_p4_GENE_NODE_646_length_6978_cov_73_701490_g492_i0NODE_646_length_6978_cov_73_701490_g492_i0_p4_ORF_typecomplete_len176_score30_72Met_10/PF02475_16/0_00012_NODE_646_length_6978_cov_73_701490_g492_i09601487